MENKPMETSGTKQHADHAKTMNLVNELVFRKYYLAKDDVLKFFHNISIREYLALHLIQEISNRDYIYGGKTYLKELSAQMDMPLNRTSRMVQDLKRKNCLTWSHDGDGSEGTYVQLTEHGQEELNNMRNSLERFYGEVIRKFGQDNMVSLLRLLKQFDTILSAEIEAFSADNATADTADEPVTAENDSTRKETK